MYNPKFTTQSDFVDSFLNRVILDAKFNKEEIANDAKIYEACVNLNMFNLNFSECGDKRDKVESFIDNNQLQGFKQQLVENCSNEVLESHSLAYQEHRNQFTSPYGKIINQLALKDSLSNLSQCINKI